MLRTKRLLALDEHVANPITGRFVLVEDYLPSAAASSRWRAIPTSAASSTVRSTNITAVGHAVTREARSARNGHKGGVLWFTGLSGAGKSTLALALERELFAKGYNVYRARRRQYPRRAQRQSRLQPRGPGREHPPRRRGRVPVRRCRLPRHQLVHLALPLRPRARPRRAPEYFHEVYVQADVETCEPRDLKGLYKARKGEIPEFTGISAPYEVPENPELTLNTMIYSIDECVAQLAGLCRTPIGRGSIAGHGEII